MSTPKCLITGCNRLQAPSLNFGLCLICYSRAKKMVEQGKTTWDHLIALGLALAVSDGGGDPFTAAFNEKTK